MYANDRIAAADSGKDGRFDASYCRDVNCAPSLELHSLKPMANQIRIEPVCSLVQPSAVKDGVSLIHQVSKQACSDKPVEEPMFESILEATQTAVTRAIALTWASFEKLNRILEQRQAVFARLTGKSSTSGQGVVKVDAAGELAHGLRGRRWRCLLNYAKLGSRHGRALLARHSQANAVSAELCCSYNRRCISGAGPSARLRCVYHSAARDSPD